MSPKHLLTYIGSKKMTLGKAYETIEVLLGTCWDFRAHFENLIGNNIIPPPPFPPPTSPPSLSVDVAIPLHGMNIIVISNGIHHQFWPWLMTRA